MQFINLSCYKYLCILFKSSQSVPFHSLSVLNLNELPIFVMGLKIISFGSLLILQLSVFFNSSVLANTEGKYVRASVSDGKPNGQNVTYADNLEFWSNFPKLVNHTSIIPKTLCLTGPYE